MAHVSFEAQELITVLFLPGTDLSLAFEEDG